MKQTWIYDIEQYPNFHCATFQSKDGKEIRQFAICELRNDLIAYHSFLTNEIDRLIGFNNLNYDSVMLNFLFKIMEYPVIDPLEINELLYQFSYQLINEEVQSDRITQLKKHPIWKEMDLYKIHHFDNEAKRTSLKAVGIAIKHENIQDLPYDPDSYIRDLAEINQILLYNLNDVEITRKLYDLTQEKIQMRLLFGQTYNIDILNANDPQIGTRLIAKYLTQSLRISPYELSQMRTYRDEIKLDEIILPYIKFRTPQFQEVLKKFSSTIVRETKNAFEDFSCIINEVKYVFGTGGIHGAKESGIYELNGSQSILLIDVSSFYPNIAIQNRFYPEHLSEKFCEVYNDIYQKRLTAKRSGNSIIDSGLKLALNATFGKSNDQYSFLYDPAFTMKITVNGQLLLAMLAEDLILENIEILQVNTDGIMIRCNTEEIPLIETICEEWEKLTKLKLDFEYFSKIIMRDVNSYIAVYQHPKSPSKLTKQKGAFLIERELYKDHSMKVVRLAVHEYFVKGIPIEQTIRNHSDIYDFCFRYKGSKDWITEEHYLNKNREQIDRLSKNTRFYISRGGSSLYKRNKKDGRIIGLMAGETVTVFNRYFHREMKDYDIDYAFYIRQAYDLIYTISDGQLLLW